MEVERYISGAVPSSSTAMIATIQVMQCSKNVLLHGVIIGQCMGFLRACTARGLTSVAIFCKQAKLPS